MAQKKTATRFKSASSKKKAARSSDEQERYVKAVGAFERALRALYKRDIEKAHSQFSSLISAFPEERELADRARGYIAYCEGELTRSASSKPKELEELITQGVFLHNRGEYDEAIKYLTKAVEMDPKNDHAHYCLAAAYARVGDSRGASRHLKRAITSDSYNRVLAKTDSDFQSIRNDPSLADLLSEDPSSLIP